MNKKEEPSIKDITCPVCGGCVNNMWFDPSSSTETMASFIVECWSGDLEKESHKHIFRVKIFDLPVLEIVE